MTATVQGAWTKILKNLTLCVKKKTIINISMKYKKLNFFKTVFWKSFRRLYGHLHHSREKAVHTNQKRVDIEIMPSSSFSWYNQFLDAKIGMKLHNTLNYPHYNVPIRSLSSDGVSLWWANLASRIGNWHRNVSSSPSVESSRIRLTRQ